MQTKNRIKPLIPYRIQINSILAYKKFFKNRYKLAHSLGMEMFHSKFGKKIRSKMIKKKLLKIAQKLKFVSGLQLHKCIITYLDPKDAQFLTIIKLFSNLTRLSLSFSGVARVLLTSYAKWIASIKNLKTLHFIFRKYLSQNTFSELMINQTKKLVHTLKRKRLRSLRILIESNYNALLKPLVEFSHYPSTLKNLSFVWNGFGNVLSNNSLSVSNSMLSHMKNLSALSLVLPISVDSIQSIVASVPDTTKLSMSEFEIFNLETDNDQVLGTLGQNLTSFTQVNRLFLKFKSWPGKLVKNWKLLTYLPLIEFRLNIPINDINDLNFISQIIGGMKELRALTLRILTTKPVDFLEQKSFTTLFEETSQLKNLEKLKIYFIVFYPPDDNNKSFHFISSLGKCINCLSKLREISIRFRHGDMRNEYSDLLQSLKDKASNLNKIRLNFAKQNMKETDLKSLCEIISELRSIKVIVLDELQVGSAESLQSLLNSFCSLDSLKKLRLNIICQEIDETKFTEFVRNNIIKKGFKALNYVQNTASVKINPVNDQDKINLKQILKKNLDLDMVYTSVPFNIYAQDLDISFIKWDSSNFA